MIWLVILSAMLAFFLWLLLAPVELFIDSRMATIYIRWTGIGYATIAYEKNEWWLKIRVLFYAKRWRLLDLFIRKPAEGKVKREGVRKKRKKIVPGKIIHLIKTFRITKWQAAIDTGDNILNAWLYPLTSFPVARRHLFINFTDVNYVAVTVKNRPVRLIYAWLNY